MNLFTATFSKIFKSSNQQVLDKIKPSIIKINSLEKSISSLKDSEFKERTHALRKKVQNGENLEKILPESFALVREAAKRVLNERHFDVQLVGGVVLHQGKIAEMKTGEGKTLVSTLPAFLNALDGSPFNLSTSVGLKYLGSTLITISPVSARLPISLIPLFSHIIALLLLSLPQPSSIALSSINLLTVSIRPVDTM